ncbi:MAG: hypothetical protein MI725_00090 [Pirellulales bacterium]|nr:hypothetical protein [Pirellulales bacterium]
MLRVFILAAALLTSVRGGDSLLFAESSPEAPQQTQEPQEAKQRVRFQRLRNRFSRDTQVLGLAPLLRVESIRQELKIDEHQSTVVEDISISIREDLGEEIRALLRLRRDQSPEEHQEARGRRIEIRKKINKRIQTALSEEQFLRLRQIGLQLDLRRAGAAETLTSEELAAALDLTEQQKQQLRQQAEQSQTATAQGKPPTLSEARAVTKDILTEEQQEKLDTLLGREFDLPEAMLQEGPKRRMGGRRGPREEKRRPPFQQESPTDTPGDSA